MNGFGTRSPNWVLDACVFGESKWGRVVGSAREKHHLELEGARSGLQLCAVAAQHHHGAQFSVQCPVRALLFRHPNCR